MVIGIDEKCIVKPEISYFSTDVGLNYSQRRHQKKPICRIFESLCKSFIFVIWLTLQMFPSKLDLAQTPSILIFNTYLQFVTNKFKLSFSSG